MTDIVLEPPRTLRSAKPVRVVLVNGFLGAGKTTALCALARRLTQRGLRVGFITNDQAANLVDTAILSQAGAPIAEVAGGCFCCKFSDLLDAARAVLETQPDVLLCEPVGSCTDMAATVVNPLRLFYRNVLHLSPFTVLVDPERARQYVLGESATTFPEEVGYIFRKQLEEADLIALSKIDTLAPGEADRITDALRMRYGRPVLQLSASGMDAWADYLLGDHASGTYILTDIDYDTYATGEAVLGWLNMTVSLQGHPTFEPRMLARSIMFAFRDACAGTGEIAHVKLVIPGDELMMVQANLTRADGKPVIATLNEAPLETAKLVLNARVRMDPGTLGAIAVRVVLQAAREAGADADIESVQSFSPGYPRPPYRLKEVVG